MKVKKVAKFNSDLSKVFNIVTDNSDYGWRTDLKCIIVHDDKRFTEIDINDYEVDFEITKLEPNYYYAFKMMSKNTFGVWSGKFFESDNGGTIVEFIEDVSANKLLMKLFLKPFLKKHQSNYIRDLRKKLEE